MKDFDNWSKLKKQLDSKDNFPFPQSREIWWCSLGLNIGVEIDGKNENFERPVLVLRVYNKEMIKIVPLTTKEKTSPFYFKINAENISSFAVLSQIRVISAKRMIRKISNVSVEEFKKLKLEIEKIG